MRFVLPTMALLVDSTSLRLEDKSDPGMLCSRHDARARLRGQETAGDESAASPSDLTASIMKSA
jgi:hypothetical protein